MSPHPGLPAPSASIDNHPPHFFNGQSRSPSDIAEYAMKLMLKKTQSYFVFVFLLVLGSRIGTIEGCLPSWFRKERSDFAHELESTTDVIANDINEPTLPVVSPTLKTNVVPSRKKYYQTSNSVEDSEDLDSIYGTAKPIEYNHQLEAARQRHAERECHGWCYRGGSCTVEIDEVTHELKSKSCRCPHDYWGHRCELHFVVKLYAPVKGHIEVERSAMPTLAFILIMMVISIGLTLYTYRKLSRRNESWNRQAALGLLSLKHHLRRRQPLSLYATPSVIDTTPSSCRSITSRSFFHKTPFSPIGRFGKLATNWAPHPIEVVSSFSALYGRLSVVSTPISLRLNHLTVEYNRSQSERCRDMRELNKGPCKADSNLSTILPTQSGIVDKEFTSLDRISQITTLEQSL